MKEYLGDAVYAEYDGYMIHLYTHNGIHPTNSIYLEPSVTNNLLEYIKRLIKETNAQHKR